MVPHLTRQSTSPLFLYLIRPAVCCVIDDIVALGWMLAVNKRFSLTRPVCLLPFFSLPSHRCCVLCCWNDFVA